MGESGDKFKSCAKCIDGCTGCRAALMYVDLGTMSMLLNVLSAPKSPKPIRKIRLQRAKSYL